MKTVNLTPWCSLYSTASKYSIQVKKSYYKPLMNFGSLLSFFLLLLLCFSYAYHLVLALAIFTMIVLGVLIAQKSGKQARVEYQFELSQQGVCTFDSNVYYQIQASSRLSFLGCWLKLVPVTAKSTLLVNKYKQLFIYRDSLCEQDFSRLSRLLKDLSSSAVSIH